MPLSPQQLRDLFAQLGARPPAIPHPPMGTIGVPLADEDSPEANTDRALWRVLDERGTDDMPTMPMPMSPGQLDIHDLPQAELAQLDRYGFGKLKGQQIPGGKLGALLLALPYSAGAGLVAGVNELDKGLTGGQVAHAVTGDPQFLVDKTSSPASLENVIGYAMGMMDGATDRFADKGGTDQEDQPFNVLRFLLTGDQGAHEGETPQYMQKIPDEYPYDPETDPSSRFYRPKGAPISPGRQRMLEDSLMKMRVAR